jgi:hypothetical protein
MGSWIERAQPVCVERVWVQVALSPTRACSEDKATELAVSVSVPVAASPPLPPQALSSKEVNAIAKMHWFRKDKFMNNPHVDGDLY